MVIRLDGKIGTTRYDRSRRIAHTIARSSQQLVSRFFSASFSVRDQYPMGFTISSCSASKGTQPICRSYALVSKKNTHFRLGSFKIRRDLDFFLNVTNVRRLSSDRGPSSFFSPFLSLCECSEVLRVKLGTNLLKYFAYFQK